MLYPNGTSTAPHVSSPYGPRDPSVGISSFHAGTDYTGFSTIKAIAAGKVTRANYMNGAAGNTIAVDIANENGVVTTVMYMHLASFLVPNGAYVTEGQAIGIMGKTGNPSGICLHLEIRFWKNGNYTTTDPVPWLAARVGGQAAGGGNTDVWSDSEKQTFLVSIGLDTGGIGNGWGPMSKTATTTFQNWVGLPEDGVFGPNTTAVAKTIQGGHKMDSVTHTIEEIQKLVGTPADGKWGNKTSLRTYMWQRSVGLAADAVFGPASEAKAWPPVVIPPVQPGQWPTDGRKAVPDLVRTTKQIQQLLIKEGILPEGSDDDVYGPNTSAGVAQLQSRHWLDADGIYGIASDGSFFPQGLLQGCDYSFARPAPSMLAQRGLKLVGRYLASDGNGKHVDKAEIGSLNAQALDVFFIYEEDGKELLGGFDAGVRVAKAAETLRIAQGVGLVPIYFNTDFEVSDAQLPTILAALDGIASVIGVIRTGLYGGYKAIKTAFDTGKIQWGFQTYAWSDPNKDGVTDWDPRAQLQQWANGQWGGTVDFTRAMVAEFGQNPVVVPPIDPTDSKEVPLADLQDALEKSKATSDAIAKMIG